MDEILQLNILPMYFLYGLSFYTMGIAIALQYRSYSSFRMAHSLSLLAAFAMLHGLSEWGSVFIPVKLPDFGDFPLWKLLAIQRLLQSVSYFFLFCFGVKLISDSRNQNFFWWVTLPTVAFLGWLVHFSLFIPRVGTDDLIQWLLHTEYWSRYILAFPAGVLTAYGLALQAPEVEKINERSVLRNLWAATAAFGFFALFSGLVVPHEVGWFSSYLNADVFRRLTGMPIEVLRTVAAMMATWSITSMLAIFDLEKLRQVSESRRLEAVYRERERFARDLHDDVIQSIYGVGLHLQTTIPLIEKEPPKAKNQVSSAVERLNKVMHTLRAYIHGLGTQSVEQDMKTILAEMVNQFRDKTGLKIRLNFWNADFDRIRLLVEVEDWQQQLQQIIREALNNVVRHAQASKAEVDIHTDGSYLVVKIKDNGLGLPDGDFSWGLPGDAGRDMPGESAQPDETGTHMGMRNMRSRAMLLGGELEIYSRPGDGTRLVISIPLAS